MIKLSQNTTLIPTQVDIQAINMARKHSHKKIMTINSSQIEAIERQYWTKYNNNNLESMLNYKRNTTTVG